MLLATISEVSSDEYNLMVALLSSAGNALVISAVMAGSRFTKAVLLIEGRVKVPVLPEPVVGRAVAATVVAATVVGATVAGAVVGAIVAGADVAVAATVVGATVFVGLRVGVGVLPQAASNNHKPMNRGSKKRFLRCIFVLLLLC